jgi:SAM-dependent methyltransferase
MARLDFLFKVIFKHIKRSDKSCPFCQMNDLVLLGSKYFFLKLYKCNNCLLMFRYPKDNVGDNSRFYNFSYKEGFTTTVPEDSNKLEEYTKTNFHNSDKNFLEKIDIIKRFVKPKSHLLDFGCSWGYGTWQFKKAGFNAIGFEVDKNRAAYGRNNLGLEIIDNYQDLFFLPDSGLDLIFTNHVLEHLPNLNNIFNFFSRVLKPKGKLMIIVPNCSGMEIKDVFNSRKIYAFGEKHSLTFSNEFFETSLPKFGFDVQTTVSPYSINDLFVKKNDFIKKDCSELLVLGTKKE